MPQPVLARRPRGRLVPLLLVAVLGAAGLACGRGARPTAKKPRGPAILRLVPADTPYILASLEPLPEGYMRLVVDAIGATIRSAAGEAAGQVQGTTPEARLGRALLEDLAGGYSVEGMARVGLAPSMRFVLYGQGLVPVLRVELADPARMTTYLQGLARRTGAVRRQLGKRPYWALASGDDVLVAAVVGKELVVTVAPRKRPELVLAAALGERPPARSLAEVDTVERVRAANQLAPHALLVVDVVRVVDILTRAPAADWEALQAMGASRPTTSPECVREWQALARRVPRIVGGMTSVQPLAWAGKVTFELDPELARQVAAARAPAPGAGRPLGDALISLSVGVDARKLIEVLRARAAAVVAAPYRCPDLAWVNDAARTLAGALGQTPTWARQVRGLTVVLHALRTTFPFDVKGYAVLSASDPLQLVDLARRMVPQLASLKVPPDGKPIALPSLVPLMPTAYVALRGELLGVSIGSGMDAELARIFSAAPVRSTPAFELSYNPRRLMEAIRGFEPEAGRDIPSFLIELDGVLTATLELDDHGISLGGVLQLAPRRR